MHKTKTASAWAPNHITGFFYSKMDKDPMQSSSLGAGVNLMCGTTTQVEAHPSSQNEVSVFINNQRSDAELSHWIVDKFFDKYVSDNFTINIQHTMEMPLSAGFGTSGSGALSLALALRKAFNREISDEQCFQLAHIADVENKGGLGTVMAEIAGGLEIRVAFGGPGIGKVETIPLGEEYQVIVLYFGSYQTKEALSDKYLMEKVHTFGKSCVATLLKDPTVEHFLELSQWFVKKIEVATGQVSDIIKKMERHGFLCSMPLFGESVFSIQPTKKAHELKNILQEYGKVYISDISTGGPHVN
jgi:pantoate kinase